MGVDAGGDEPLDLLELAAERKPLLITPPPSTATAAGAWQENVKKVFGGKGEITVAGTVADGTAVTTCFMSLPTSSTHDLRRLWISAMARRQQSAT